jgi:hypothetical protein
VNLNRWIVMGGAAAFAGLALIGGSFSGSTAFAGGTAPTNTPQPCIPGFLPSPTGTAIITARTDGHGPVSAFQVPPTDTPTSTATATAVPLCTATPTQPARTHTPVPSNTPLPTDTPAPTNTLVPTQPSGAPGGTVRPPDTGSGGDAGNGSALWAIIAGAALVVVGGGAGAIGLRRRGR